MVGETPPVYESPEGITLSYRRFNFDSGCQRVDPAIVMAGFWVTFLDVLSAAMDVNGIDIALNY